jgi:type VI protein secretion system component Hcp
MISNQIVESITPAKWCLLGSIPTPEYLLRTSLSLQVFHRIGLLSPQIRSALNARSTLPLVEIHTWNDTVSLVNATVVAIVPPVRHSTGKGSTGSKGLNTHELERIEIAFQKIDITFNGSGKKGKGALDNWNVPT